MTTPDQRQEPTLEPAPMTAPLRSAPPRPVARRRGLSWLWTLLILLSILPAIVLALRWVPPPFTAFMLQSETKPFHYQWVPAGRIADTLRRAVVAAEDQKFFMHQGFDLEAIEKALAQNEKQLKKGKRRRLRGGSTISQQTAKNLFLWPGGGYFRKAIEATITMLMEFFWGKDRILEVYLNVAEFGPGIYGAEAAAQLFFSKPAAALSAPEAAQLAAVLPSPRRWSVRAPGPYVQKRMRWILGQMGYGRPAPADEPEPLPPLSPGEEMPALDAWQDDGAQPEPAEDEGEALPGVDAVPEPDATAPESEPEPAPDAPATELPAQEPESTPGVAH